MLRYGFLAAVTSALVGCAGQAQTEEDLGTQTQAAGVTGPAFYVEGKLVRTVLTPTTLSESQPDHTFDTLYDLGGLQLNVAESGPGLPDYDGGRWMVHQIVFDDYAMALENHDANASGNFDFASEVEAALAAGDATDLGVVARFACPVIPISGQ
jgi:hypothetical protein